MAWIDSPTAENLETTGDTTLNVVETLVHREGEWFEQRFEDIRQAVGRVRSAVKVYQVRTNLTPDEDLWLNLLDTRAAKLLETATQRWDAAQGKQEGVRRYPDAWRDPPPGAYGVWCEPIGHCGDPRWASNGPTTYDLARVHADEMNRCNRAWFYYAKPVLGPSDASLLWEEFRIEIDNPDIPGYRLKLCGLCGDSGVVDTRPTEGTSKRFLGGVQGYCICPKGRGQKARRGT